MCIPVYEYNFAMARELESFKSINLVLKVIFGNIGKFGHFGHIGTFGHCGHIGYDNGHISEIG